MNTVLDPSILLITETDWREEDKKDAFLKNLINNLKYIDDYSITKVYLTNNMGCLLWGSSDVPPWRKDKDSKLPLVQALYKRWTKCYEFIEIETAMVCGVIPKRMHECCNADFESDFMKMMHFLIISNEAVFFCPHTDNCVSNSDIYFFCKCHPKKLRPILIRKYTDWLDVIDLPSNFWPQRRDRINIDNFYKGINVALERNAIRMNKEGTLYAYEFSNHFIADLIDESDYSVRGRIFDSIAKRLLLNRSEAENDGGLLDELVQGKNERRFRISKEIRIHYYFNANGVIEFTRYFGAGQHDEGLQ